jgi:hypothetical protein
MRIESSIITSLSELRAIEQQRIAEERATVEREKQRVIDEARAAELARVLAENARIEAERQERIRIEQARADAEREARMRVEAAESAERMRLAAELEQRRMAEEIELRRAEVAKKRPTWMIAVTAVAFVTAIGLSVFAASKSNDAERAHDKAAAAQRQQDDAKRELADAIAKLDGLQADVAKSDQALEDLRQRLIAAQTEADRKRLEKEVAAEQQRKRDIQGQIDAEKARQAHAKRVEQINVKGCTDTALGCLDRQK